MKTKHIAAKLMVTGLFLACGSASAAEFTVPMPVGPGARIPLSQPEPFTLAQEGPRAAEAVFGRWLDPVGGLHHVNGRLFSIRLVGVRSPAGELSDRIAVVDVSDAHEDPSRAVGCSFPLGDAERSFRLREGGHVWRLNLKGGKVAFLGPDFEEGSQYQAVETSVTELRDQRRARAEGGLAVQYTGRFCVQTLDVDGRLADLSCDVETWKGVPPAKAPTRRMELGDVGESMRGAIKALDD